MKKFIILILVSFLVLVQGLTYGQAPIQQHIDWQAGLLNLDLDSNQEADLQFKNRFFNQYYMVYQQFLRTMVCQSFENHARLSALVDIILDLGRDQKQDIREDFEKTSYISGSLLLRAVSAAQYGEYANSAKDLYRAYRYYLDMVKLQPNHNSTKIYGGILAILYGKLPNEYYNWLAIIGIRLDPEDGFRQLKEVYYSTRESGGTENLEPALIVIIALKEFDEDPKAAWHFIQMEGLKKHSNVLVRYYSAVAAFRAGYTHEALQLIDDLDKHGEAEKIPYAYYMKGRFLLYQDDPLAIEAFKKFFMLNRGENYIKSAWQKMGWYFIMQDKKAMASDCFQKVGSEGYNFLSADQQALREVENESVPLKDILRLRLLFDGGFYEKCLDNCSHFEKSRYRDLSNRQIVEVLYRQARSHQYLGNHARALDYYRQIVEDFTDVPSYQVPNAALQAGILLGISGQKQEAEIMLSKCLKINNYGYQATIRREAHSEKRKL